MLVGICTMAYFSSHGGRGTHKFTGQRIQGLAVSTGLHPLFELPLLRREAGAHALE